MSVANVGDQSVVPECLVGDLDTWPLHDVLLWMSDTRRSGMVRVGDGCDAGVIFVRAGTVFRAEWGRRKGAEALLDLLMIDAGQFVLVQREVPTPRANIDIATPELLLRLLMLRGAAVTRAFA